MPDYLATPSLCDYVVLEGQRSPGVARVRAPSSPRKWDERDGHGASGATLVYNGDKIAHFEIEIDLWETQHFDDWDAFKVLLQRAPKGTKPKAMDISHPFTDEHGIASVVVEDLVGPEVSDQGLTTWVVKLAQYRPPTPAQGKPAGSGAQPGGTDAKTEADKQIEQLTQQVKELSK
jgi:hypothetical protein